MPVDESITELKPFERVPDRAHIVEESPEKINVSMVQTRDGPKKVTTAKRVIKKKVGRKQSITEITTKTVQGQVPITTVIVSEVDLPLEQVDEMIPSIEKPEHIYELTEELPEHIQVTEIQTKEGPVQKTVVKKQTIKKHKQGKKEKVIEILTKQVDDKQPETLVTISEVDTIVEDSTEPLQLMIDTLTEKASKTKELRPQLLQEFTRKSSLPQTNFPEEEKVTEIVMEESQIHKKTLNRRVVSKHIVSELDEEIKPLITPIEHIEMIEDETFLTLDEVTINTNTSIPHWYYLQLFTRVINLIKFIF